MKLGYFTLSDNPPFYGANRRDANQFLRDILAECLAAEDLGFNSVWVPEHHFGLFGCLPSPATFLGYVAARTERVQLGAATVVLPCNHPLRVAEEWALLDLLSNGRAVFSAGRGYDAREYAAFEIPFAESRGRFDEELLIVTGAWTTPDFTFEGQYHRITEPVTVLPRPTQQPHPPVVVACFSEPTMEMAARNGFDIIFAPFAAAMMFGSLEEAAAKFRRLAAEAGFPNSKVKCSYFLALADTEQDELAARERLLYYLHGVLPALPGDLSKAPPHIAYFADIAKRIEAMEPSQLRERSIVTGTPEHCVEHLKRVEAAGVEEVICYFNFGGLPHDKTLAQMERFSREVLPSFDSASASPGPSHDRAAYAR
jgi:alkanesulfonate monooxygenase SsuD/methylene tetrahydromethanopterin reductase-like flavin-dependent oxidoreductase (luciferase family)